MVGFVCVSVSIDSLMGSAVGSVNYRLANQEIGLGLPYIISHAGVGALTGGLTTGPLSPHMLLFHPFITAHRRGRREDRRRGEKKRVQCVSYVCQ